LSTRGVLALARAEFDEGERILDEAVELLARIDHPAVHGATVSHGLLLGHHRGYAADLLAAPTWDFGTDVRWDVYSRLARAFVLVDNGRLDEASALYNRCGDLATWGIPRRARLVVFAIAARVAASLGAHDDVARLRDLLAPYRGWFVAAGGGGSNFLGPVDLALGRCAASLGQYDVACGELEAAVTMCRTIGAPGFGVEADTELAEVHARAGAQAAATAGARRALPMARTLGMTPWADRLATLVGLDERTDPLTAREREIASLVAAGLSNRAIADRLVISERTAQNHVQHILGKLGFANRAQIAAWASRSRRDE
jgi:DNA-binding CsgD family transcriptional regulator